MNSVGVTPGGPKVFRCAVASVVKHAYVPRGVAAHGRFELVVVTDDAAQPDWVHERNQAFATEYKIPYIRDPERAFAEFGVDVAIVSSEAERHVDLSVRAARAGLHVIQDKPLSTRLSECDRLVAVMEQYGVRFLMWNRNFLPAIRQACDVVSSGQLGDLRAVHIDFYFSKDCGPPKGSLPPGSPPIDWYEHQKRAHVDGSDGGLGQEPMGELQIEGIYPLAYLRMITGQEVQQVFARTAAHFHQLYVDHGIDDLATVTLELTGQVKASLCLGRIGAASHPDIGEIKLHLVGTRGAAVISEARPEVGVYYRGQPPHEFRHRRIEVENDFFLLEDFARAIDTRSETILDARASRAIAATVEAALQSARTGDVVSVPPLPPCQVRL